jgi:hypothetical protein
MEAPLYGVSVAVFKRILARFPSLIPKRCGHQNYLHLVALQTIHEKNSRRETSARSAPVNITMSPHVTAPEKLEQVVMKLGSAESY